jgi:ABC-type branched-subunit amino acid transport system substrate-binding protein
MQAAAPAREPEKSEEGRRDSPWKSSLVPYLQQRKRPADGQADAGEAAPAPPAAAGAVRIALLLPLSGPNAGLGQAMLEAAQMALFDFADDRFELLPHDTGGTPEGAQEAARLAVSDGASLVLGPLLASSVKAVAPIVKAANVPMISFSSDRTVAGDGVYVMGFLPRAEVARVVAFARRQGHARLAAIAPDNAYGATVVQALQQAAQDNGAKVTRVRLYDPQTSDFTELVKDLASYDQRRQALLLQRKELEGRDDEISRRALQRLERLQTLGELPFDALLIAEGGKKLQAIAALLPFYDVDPNRVRMLGTGQWDEPGLGAEPALVGGWFAAPPPEARADFERQFEQAYERPPPRLATLAYDATALAAVLAKGEGGPDFGAKALTKPSGYYGRDGIFRFLADGIAERGLAVLQVRPKGAQVVGPPPEAFQAAIN